MVVAAQFIVFVGFNMIIPFLPLFIQELGIRDPGQVAAFAGIQQTSSSIGMALCAPVWGALADRFGRKPMLIRAVGLGALTIGLTGFVQNIGQLLAMRFLIGALTGVQGAAMALSSSLAPRSRTGYAVGLIQMASYSGTFVGPLVGGLLADSLGFRLSSVVAGALLAVAALAIFALVHEDFVGQAIPRARGAAFVRNLRELIASQRLTALLAIIFCAAFAVYGVSPMMPLFIQRLPSLPGSTATITGITLGLAGLCSAISAPMLGRLGVRVGYSRILLVSAGSAALAAAGILLVFNVAPLLVAEAVLGAAAGGLLPVAFTMVSLRTPRERQGSVYGLTSSVSAFGTAIGPLSAGLLAAGIGIRPVFGLFAAMFLVVAGLTLTVPNRRPVPVAS
jgi:MFS transporter, DHA1 family, multidrug resistance protein